jgi:hypothetical protein
LLLIVIDIGVASDRFAPPKSNAECGQQVPQREKASGAYQRDNKEGIRRAGFEE